MLRQYRASRSIGYASTTGIAQYSVPGIRQGEGGRGKSPALAGGGAGGGSRLVAAYARSGPDSA
eukprot:1628074-Rhodomonas_salina.1